MCLKTECDGTIIWADKDGGAIISNVENDSSTEVTFTVEGKCEKCGHCFYCIASGDIEDNGYSD